MKKTAIALAVFAAALFAVSCQKENAPVQNISGPMTISAEAEGLNTLTKTELAIKFDVLWSAEDKIYVKDTYGNDDTFTLESGAKTTKGTFKQDNEEVSLSGDVKAYYPSTLVLGESFVWPESQDNDQTIPMYCEKKLSGSKDGERMDFTSLGSVLQLTFSTTSKDVVLKSIEVKADQAMSGEFIIEDIEGNKVAKINQPEEGDKPGVTLDLGDAGVALGVTAKKFNIAIPAGTYSNLTITFIAKDGQKCIKHATKPQTIAYKAVNTLSISGEFELYLPDFALLGGFTVNDEGKKVYFSRGNLYYDGSDFKFETNQYGIFIPSDDKQWSTNHISHFYYCKDPNEAIQKDYNEDQTVSDGDVIFTNDPTNAEKAKSDFTVNGVPGKYRTLSADEWQYLFSKHSYIEATVNGVIGYVIAPDDFEGALKGSYTDDAELAASGNLVFLPAAGNRYGSFVDYVGEYGYYWSSSSMYTFGKYYASQVSFSIYESNTVKFDTSRLYSGFSVRLVTEPM